MAMHFDDEEFQSRKSRVLEEMAARKYSALLLFAPESHYWLTGYDTFGFCFFQCLILTEDGESTLLTRSADRLQAVRTSNIKDIVIWADRPKSDPANVLRDLLNEKGLLGASIGIEYDTHGLTASDGRKLDDALRTFSDSHDASDLIRRFRLIKSPAELTYVKQAAEIADTVLDEALGQIAPGADEGNILAAMQASVFQAGGDYPGNPFVIGSGSDALLCRTKSGRRVLDAQDQITLEFAGVYRMYHCALMRTIVVGEPTPRHLELQTAAVDALNAVQVVLRPGHTFGDVFAAHATAMENHGMTKHRLNACGYSLGARYAPHWMDWPMFYRDNPEPVEPGMVLFAHMILMDAETDTAMCMGRTYLTTEGAPESLSRHGTDMLVR